MLLTGVPPALWATPIITQVVETGGDEEETDTITAKWTGETFMNGVANEPIAGKAADAPYTVGLFVEEAPMFVDRNHQWNGATTSIPIPAYLLGGEYIMSGNDNRDNPEYRLEITISEESFVYMLVDDRLGETQNGNPPNFPDWTGDRSGDGLPDMAWLAEQGWEPVISGLNRHGNPEWPDHVGADEGGDGVGPGAGINQWSSIYVKRIPAGTFSIFAPDNPGQNMYGVVVKAVPQNPTVTKAVGDLFGFRFDISDGSQTALNTNSIALTLDGSPVTNFALSKTGPITKIDYAAPAPLPSGSEHTVALTFADNATPPATSTETLNFRVESYGVLTPDMKVTPDTSKPGFIWRVFQNAGNQENTTVKAEQAVLGELRGTNGDLLPNQADPAAQGVAEAAGTAPSPANGLITFEIPTVINLSQVATEANGNFPDDGQMPGIPGTTGSDDGIAAEIVTYVELPAGLITMGVNSDDGFHTSGGPVQDAVSRVKLGEFVGGRGAADTIFRVAVQEAGVYPLRTVWEEGNSSANIEWFTIKADGTKVLLNDTANGGLNAYRAATTPTGAYVRKAFPLPGATGVRADSAIDVELVDGTTSVDPNSVALKLDGAATAPSVNKTGGSTTVTLPASNLLASGSSHQVELTYQAGAETVSRSWGFEVATYPTISPDLATAVGTGRDRGFRIRTVQTEAGLSTADAAAEQQLLITGETNIADLSAAGADGYFVHPGVINFNQDAPANAGNFTADNGFEDQTPPGIPGTLGGNDNFAQEILTFLEFPAAGYYTMGVNSDDGFKILPAQRNDTNAPVLGIFNGGRGVADSIFSFGVPQAGVYPFRMIWYEGGGGAAAEWFTVTEDGARVLINSDAASGIKAFQARTEEPSPRPTLTLSRSGTGFAITYTGTLQSADQVTGTFTDVPGASSPYTVPTAGAAGFYRTRQ